ncbi:MAG: MarR family transcriptional regulator [Candidatus Omnitrophica bacterium]|nr:MarR family transcriptional regulator [Candidatus Omnitrophota bacterium]
MSLELDKPGPRYAALMELLRTAESLWKGSRLFFAKWELGPSQFNVLNLLFDRTEGLSQVELSRQLIMHRSNMTGLVDRLEARGLVQRRAVPGDRRAHRVVLTSDGSRLLREILPCFYEAAEEVWGNLPIDQVNRLVAELKRIGGNAERMAATR